MPTKKNIESPELLYQHFEKYKEDCKNNPKKENFWSHKSDKQVSIDREPPLTWEGFEVWLRKKKILCVLDDYKSNKDGRYPEYAYIIRAIDTEIWEDQYAGAVAGIFQHNIIARKLGLSENVSVHTEQPLFGPLKDEDEEKKGE